MIVDVDPGSHGLALLEGISALHCRPPIIVLTALEESHMEPVVARHGAAACLGKPLSSARLCAVIEQVTGGETHGESSDTWGHPRGDKTEVKNGAPA